MLKLPRKTTPHSQDLTYTKERGKQWLVIIKETFGGARDVMVIVVGNGHGDTSSNPW